MSNSPAFPRRILVRGTNWLGDAVMTTPALRRLRSSFPQAHITLLVTPLTAQLFTAAPFVDEIITYHRRQQGVRTFIKTVRQLRRRHYDLALLFQNAFEAALLARLAGIPRRIGFATQGRRALLTQALPYPTDHRNRHQTHDYLDLVIAAERDCGLLEQAQQPKDTTPSLTATPLHCDAATALFNQHGILTGSLRAPLVALNTAATNSRAKCWPTARFAAVADQLIEQRQAKIILIGTAAEYESAARVIAQMRQPGAINLAGKTTMIELIGVLDRCDLLITNDTGPAHVAAARGRPTLTIFGPTNEFETAPLGRHAEIIRAEGIECARCMHRDCPIDHRCMTRIDVEEVIRQALGLMDENVAHLQK